MTTDTNKPSTAAEPASEQTCPACLGDGDMLVMNGRGPDTYETIEPCSTCGGTGAVPAPAVDERTAPASDKDMAAYQSIADKYAGHLAAASNGSPGGESRLRRKLEKRDQRIAGMKRRIEALEHALATRTMDLESLSRNVERAVTHALCNVRMIPVHGFGRDPKIVEVKLTDAPRRSAATSPDADGQMKKD